MGVSTNALASPGAPGVRMATYNVVISIPTNNQIANGTDNDVIKIYVTDAVTGLPVDGVSIGFLIQGTTVTTSLKTGPIGGFPAGVVLFPLASYQVGSTNVVITIGGVPVTGSPATVNFIAGPPDPNPPAGIPNATYYITTQDNATANGVAQDWVKVHLSDTYGNNVGAGIPVTFTITGGSAASNALFYSGGTTTATTITLYTDANGDIPQLPIVDTKAGDVSIKATILVSGVPTEISGSPQTVHFVVGSPDPNPPSTTTDGTLFSTTQDNATANGVAQDWVKVHLTDTYGNPVGAGIPVTFTITGGTAAANALFYSGGTSTATTITINTDANGEIPQLPLIDTKAGTVIITATILVNGSPVALNGSAQTVHFVAGAPDPDPPAGTVDGTLYSTTADPAEADGVAQDWVKVHLTDTYGNPVGAGIPVTFTIIGGTSASTALFDWNGSTTATTITINTDANGEILNLPIVNTKVGDVIISATIKVGGVDVALNGSPQTVHFITSAPDPDPPAGTVGGTNYVVTQDNATADGSSQDWVKVHISDHNGNSVANVAVTFTIYGGTAASTALFYYNGTSTATTITLYTDANGDILQLPIVDTKVGDVIIGATIKKNGADVAITNSPQTVHFVVGQPSANPPGNPAGGTTFWVDQDNATADNVQQDILKAHISDATGNAVGAGVAVTFTITGGTAAGNALFYSAGTGVPLTITLYTDANGDISFGLTDITAGSVIVKAELAGVEIHNSPVTAHFVAGIAVPSAPSAPSGTGTWLTVTQNNMPADGKKVDSVKAHITDQYGNPVANESVTFTIISGGTATAGALFQPGGVATTVTLKTDANGNIEAAISDVNAGDVWVVASIVYGGTPTLIDGSHVVATFTEAPDVTNENTRLIVVVYQALSDGVSTTSVRAHVVDKAGNVLPGWDVTFSIDSGKATIVTPQPVTTDANGDAFITLTSTTPGYVLITAVVNGESITFGSPARVKFAPINIYVPRVFTPNGDGNNDVLKPILVGISEFHYFNVYNRWGNLIFTTQDPNKGWDGTFKGVPQPVETYLWIAEGIDVLGNKVVQKGMTSLVR